MDYFFNINYYAFEKKYFVVFTRVSVLLSLDFFNGQFLLGTHKVEYFVLYNVISYILNKINTTLHVFRA